MSFHEINHVECTVYHSADIFAVAACIQPIYYHLDRCLIVDWTHLGLGCQSLSDWNMCLFSRLVNLRHIAGSMLIGEDKYVFHNTHTTLVHVARIETRVLRGIKPLQHTVCALGPREHPLSVSQMNSYANASKQFDFVGPSTTFGFAI